MRDAACNGGSSLRGLERLAAAILVQAIQDIRWPSSQTAAETIRWIQDPEENECSFAFWSRVVGLDPERLRRAMLAPKDDPILSVLGWARPSLTRRPRLRRRAPAVYFHRTSDTGMGELQASQAPN